MKPFFITFFAMIPLICLAQQPNRTRERVDALKSSIPYPKYNIGDTLFIAFINDPELPASALQENNIDVFKVYVVEMMLYNSFGGKDYDYGVYLNSPLEEYPLRWKYQYYDASLINPRYRDRSDFFDEDRFFPNPIEAKKSLLSN